MLAHAVGRFNVQRMSAPPTWRMTPGAAAGGKAEQVGWKRKMEEDGSDYEDEDGRETGTGTGNGGGDWATRLRKRAKKEE